MHLNANNIEAIAEVADQVLGHDHPVTRLIRAVHIDPDLAHDAWLAIEALPARERKVIAGLVAERLIPTRPSQAIH